ncbi:MAG: hypothetical protein NT027_04165 [Proteobacteria bacterium]|nr:hypothetical protein [Pseudomonadota bacterium]
MKLKKNKKLFVASVAIAAMSSCGKKDSDDTTATNADGSTKLETLSNPAQLGVSTALKVSLPAAYAGSSSTSLLAGKRSQEACLMGESIRSVKQSMDSIRSFFCHIEVEKDKLVFGTKTKITSKGQEFGRIWVDNSQAASGLIAVYMCQDGALKEAIKLTGVKMGSDGKPTGMKGTVVHKGSDSSQSWASNVTFDKGFTAANLQVTAQEKYSQTGSNGGSFAREVKMTLQDVSTEVSTVSVSSKGSWGGSEFSQKGYGKGASDFGQALFTNAGKDGSNQTFSWTKRSYFDKDGIVAAATASSLFGEAGSLYVKTTDLPEYLATTFAPDAPSGWDCSGADTTVDLNPESDAHKACEVKQSSNPQCWGSEFEGSQAL